MIARSQSRARSASIPTYSSSGRRVRNYSVEAVEQLLRSTPPRCSVRRNKKTGRITVCQLFPLPADSTALEGTEKLRKTIHMGQYYSRPQQVDDSGRKAWRHVESLTPRSEEAELFLQIVFRAVPLSCMAPVCASCGLGRHDIEQRRVEGVTNLVCCTPPAPVVEISRRRRPLIGSYPERQRAA